MEIVATIKENSDKAEIKIKNYRFYGDRVEIWIDDEEYVVNGQELISAIERCLLNSFGR